LEKMEGADVLAGVSGIHLGEAEAILLAQKLGTELIIDEGEASATAQMFGVKNFPNHFSTSPFRKGFTQFVPHLRDLEFLVNHLIIPPYK
jgi:hypothetical protein